MSFNEKLYSFGVDWTHGVLPVQDLGKVLYDLYCIDNDFFNYLNWSNSSRSIRCNPNYSHRLVLNKKNTIVLCYNPRSDVSSTYTSSILSNDGLGSLFAKTQVPKDVVLTEDKSNEFSYNGDIFISFTGDGLRELGDTLIKKVYSYLLSNNFRCSRIDFYCDIFDKENKLVDIISEAFDYCLVPDTEHLSFSSNMQKLKYKYDKDKNIISAIPSFQRFEYIDMMRSNEDGSPRIIHNYQFGSHSSSYGMFRMYDKWLETKTGRLSDLADVIFDSVGCIDNYWVRLEYEIHNSSAAALFNLFASCFNPCSCLSSAVNKMFTPRCFISHSSERDIFGDVPSEWVLFLDYLSSLGESHTFIQEIVNEYVTVNPLDSKERSMYHMKRYFAEEMLCCMVDPKRFLSRVLYEGIPKIDLSKYRDVPNIGLAYDKLCSLASRVDSMNDFQVSQLDLFSSFDFYNNSHI